MGTYATTTAISPFMVGVTLDTASSTLLGKCIVWAENEINRQLARRYDIAAFQASVPPMVASFAEELALGQFYITQSRGGKDGRARGQEFVKSVNSRLLELSQGKMDLVDSGGGLISPRSSAPGVLSSTVDYDSTFGEDDPLLWRIDPTKLDDLSDTRE